MTTEEMWDKLKVKRVNLEEYHWKCEENQDIAETVLLRWCEMHFSQTSDTPLASPQW